MRLIDADELRTIHSMGEDCIDCHQNVRHCQYDTIYTKMDFCGWIDDAPTVDAVPVRHGRWKCSDDSFETAVCSVCNHDTNEPFEWLIGQNDSFQFCPHCGARMDGDNNG